MKTGKLYRVVPDGEAAKHGYIRVVDESGEDYGYSAKRFFEVKLPAAARKALIGPPRRLRDGEIRADAQAWQLGLLS